MYRIGYRTIKTAIGATVSVCIAELLGLEFATAAGILTILCIQNTKKKSLEVSIARLFACLLMIVFSYVLFDILSYNVLMIGILLILFIPVAVRLNLTEGIISSTVIMMQLYSERHMTVELVINELLIIGIGIGVALLVNLYMPNVEKVLHNFQGEIENNFKVIFLEMAYYLRDGKNNWDRKEMSDTAKTLQTAKDIAFRETENKFSHDEESYYKYFVMREKQFEILERAIPLIFSLDTQYEQCRNVANCLEGVSYYMRPTSSAEIPWYEVHDLMKLFRSMPLPETREEFEVRAQLFHFLYELEHLLTIKRTYNGKYNVVSSSI